tara:strand:- start:1679 stop:2029 length:351 start_codon:yes stop_codon:yes gene_type:complete
MTQNLKNRLTEIVKEQSISDIIIENKEEMEFVRYKRLYKQWSSRKRELEDDLNDATRNVEGLKKKIKSLCKHTNVTEYISDGWERSVHDYHCNQCKFSVRIHDDFDYTNIKNVIDN